MHHRDYHRALEKILTAPLALTECDFDVLQAFNPADDVRGRAALRQAQLALLPPAAPIPTRRQVDRALAQLRARPARMPLRTCEMGELRTCDLTALWAPR